MDNEFIAELENRGVDVKTALARFMGKDAAFMAAHTVKGVAANLGLDPLSHKVEELVEIFRGVDKYPEDPKIEPLYEEAEKIYDEICDIISRYSR